MPSSLTVVKWSFCFITALLVSVVAFVMSLAIAGAHHARQLLIAFTAEHHTLAGAFVSYGSFNTIFALIGSACVLLGASRASGSGLPVRSNRLPAKSAKTYFFSYNGSSHTSTTIQCSNCLA